MKTVKITVVLFLLIFGFICQPVFALEIVNLNTASVEQLVELKGIGEKTAQKIIEYRAIEKFSSVDELTNIKGIGEKTLERLHDQLTVEEEEK